MFTPNVVYVCRQGDGHTIKITKYVERHTCTNRTGSGKNRMANSSWIASIIEEDVREDGYSLKPRRIQERVLNRHGVPVKYWVCWKALGKALTKVFGSYEDGYKWTPEVCRQILLKNQGSIASVATDSDGAFSYCCLAFDAYLKGFKEGCRPFVGLDGCHLKGKFGGVLLSAVALDANNGMYPLAIFICDSENKENWTLFLTAIRDRVNEHPLPLTFISDRQKGLIPSVKDVFPTSRHRFCFRHMFENFRATHKGTHLKTLAWGASKSYREVDHKRYMDQLENDSKSAFEWFASVETHTWARSTFDLTSKCEHVTNNFSESFNSWMLDVRSKPLHRILEGFNLKVMGLMFERKMQVKKWEGEGMILVPRADRIVKNRMEKKKRYRLFGASEYNWCVVNSKSSSRWDVDMKEKSCSCCVWDITGIPCVHAVAVATHLRIDVIRYTLSVLHFISTFYLSYVLTCNFIYFLQFG